MSNQITGRLSWVGPIVQIQSKTGGQPFQKREFLLDATPYDPYTGERSRYENILLLELGGERASELDHFAPGDVITVHFALQGREWTNSDGQLRRMISVRCYKLEKRVRSEGSGQPSAAPQPVQPAPQSAAGWQQPTAPPPPVGDMPF